MSHTHCKQRSRAFAKIGKQVDGFHLNTIGKFVDFGTQSKHRRLGTENPRRSSHLFAARQALALEFKRSTHSAKHNTGTHSFGKPCSRLAGVNAVAIQNVVDNTVCRIISTKG